MLKLRKVEIVGFKSFCERTVVTFSGSGTTCIVGPNGCGKSNVVDAISWVLGEQSHKSLRAERMADCIFNGTVKRPPLGLAEVTITMEDPELAEAARFVLQNAETESGTIEIPLHETSANTSDATEMVSLGGTVQENSPQQVAFESIEPEAKKRRRKSGDRPILATKPGEVVVSRRLYRSGQSEYLINGRPARLRDIQEMFMGVGLGPDSYAIIEQGRIGMILSTKPMERRAIIEEAAGVTKFKTKKRLAEAKLESSKVNLSRVNDIVVEVEKQLGSLKRQAAKARRYSEVRDQMRAIVRQMLAGKARELDSEAERISASLAEITASETQHAQSIAQKESEQDRLNQRIYSLDAELRQNQNLLNQTALEVDRSENRIAFNQTRCAELRGRREQIGSELAQVVAQAAECSARVSEQECALAVARAETTTLQTRMDELAARAAARAMEVLASEKKIEELRRAATLAGESLLQLHGEQKQAEEALSHQGQALRKLEVNEASLMESSIQLREDAERAAKEWQAAMGQLAALNQKAGEIENHIVGLRQRREAATAESNSLRDSLASVRVRHSTLTEILDDHSYTANAVQKLFAADENGTSHEFHAAGVLADYAEVEEKHEAAIEQYLREELEYVVVQTYDHARAGISLLQNEVGGRATFFVDSLKDLRIEEYQPIVHFRAEDGVISRLDKLVGFRDPLGTAAKQFLPRLRMAYLTENATAAERLARENSQFAFLAPDGTCYQGRMVSGGRPDDAGPLGMKRELRALDTEIVQLDQKVSEIQQTVNEVGAELESTEAAQREVAALQRDAERSVFSAKLSHEQMQNQLARFGLDLTMCQSEVARIRKEVEAAQQRASRAQSQHSVAAMSRAQAEAESARLTEALVDLRGSIQSEQDALSAARAELAAMSERLSSAEALSLRLQEERADFARRQAGFVLQQTAIVDEAAALEGQSGELAHQLAALRAEKARMEKLQLEWEQEWDAARTRVTQMEDHLRMERQSLQEIRETRGHLEVDRARNDSNRQHLRETCMAEVNAQPEDLIASEAAFMSGEELAAAEANYAEMKQRIEAMGAVNMMALEEFNECEQRFTFLTRERDDLLQSISDTQQAIAELDLATKERFEHAFHAINASFSTAFHTIFGGGMAEMRLTEPDSSGDAGIDVVASPPGKRLQNILLLSGGEKAMTALALLIAIFRYQPSPFCILDEVDAPLDEANVGRFTRLIGEMSSQTQFIIVTHNRRTMEMGSVLYGVTMQEPGVSKLVSVRWEGDSATADNQQAAAASAA